MTSALERLKHDLGDGSEAPPWTLVRKPDLALALTVIEWAQMFAHPSFGETRHPGTERESTHIGWHKSQGPTANERVNIVRAALSALTGDTK